MYVGVSTTKMKLFKLHRSKSQKEQQQQLQEADNVMQDTNAGEEEFEVIPAISPSRDHEDPQQPAEELKKQKFSLVRMFSSSNNNRNSSHRHIMTNHPNHHSHGANVQIPSSNQPFSPASTAASSTATTSMTFKDHKSKNKKKSKFMKRLKKKTSDLFNFDGPTERITVGDEYAFISVKPKTGTGTGTGTTTTNTTTTTTPSRNVVVEEEEDSKKVDLDSNVQFKKQKFSLVRMFSSSATTINKSARKHGNISRTNSTPALGGSGGTY